MISFELAALITHKFHSLPLPLPALSRVRKYLISKNLDSVQPDIVTDHIIETALSIRARPSIRSNLV